MHSSQRDAAKGPICFKRCFLLISHWLDRHTHHGSNGGKVVGHWGKPRGWKCIFSWISQISLALWGVYNLAQNVAYWLFLLFLTCQNLTPILVSPFGCCHININVGKLGVRDNLYLGSRVDGEVILLYSYISELAPKVDQKVKELGILVLVISRHVRPCHKTTNHRVWQNWQSLLRKCSRRNSSRGAGLQDIGRIVGIGVGSQD